MRTTLLAVLLAAAAGTAPARADTFWVTSLADSGAGSLRAAVEQANANMGPDTVVFHPSLSGVVELTSTIFVISSLSVVGPPSRAVTIRSTEHVFRLDASVIESPSEFGLLDLTLTSAFAIIHRSVPVRVDIHGCVFRDSNLALSGDAGVFSASAVTPPRMRGTIASCSFFNNRGHRAGVMVNSTETTGEPLKILNCTFANNQSSLGAGIAQINGTPTPGASGTDFVNCTITDNAGGTAGVPAGLIHFAFNLGGAPAVSIKNSVVHGNTAGAAVPNPNFTGFGTPGNVVLLGANIFTEPGLGPLVRANGLYVRMPVHDSPCIDKATTDPEVNVDQIGQNRPYPRPGVILQPGFDGSDLGAIEHFIAADCPADFNRNGEVTVQDLFSFLAAYFASCY